jgi:hypothetical protein
MRVHAFKSPSEPFSDGSGYKCVTAVYQPLVCKNVTGGAEIGQKT